MDLFDSLLKKIMPLIQKQDDGIEMEFICNGIHLQWNSFHDGIANATYEFSCEPRQWWLVHKSFLKLQLFSPELVLLHFDFYTPLTELSTGIHGLYKDQLASLLENESKQVCISWHSEGPAYTDNLARPQTAVYWVQRLCCMRQGDWEPRARQSLRCPHEAHVDAAQRGGESLDARVLPLHWNKSVRRNYAPKWLSRLVPKWVAESV